MKTNPNKEYNLRNMDHTYGDIDGWIGHRKNGKLYLKRFRGGASVFKGSFKLDCALFKHKNFKAFET